MGHIDFFALPGCPYCARVERALEQLPVSYEKHEVPPDKNDRRRVQERTGQTDVPAIVDRSGGIEGMTGDAAIVDYLESAYAD